MHLCQGCHAGCCRSFAVPVTGADIWKLMSGMSLRFWDFVCRWADPTGAIAGRHAPHFRFNDEPATPFTICLQHEESATFPGTSKCKFLRETVPTSEQPLGTGTCGAYAHRPSACRVFPTRLSTTGELAVLHSVPASGRRGQHDAYRLCPRPWEPADVDPVQQLQDLVVARHEMEFFHRVAEAWNRDPGPWSLFPEFLNLVYSSRVRPIEPDPAEEAMAVEPDAGDDPTILPFRRAA